MRILIDTNIVLDFLLQREPFFQETELLFQAIDAGEVVGSVTRACNWVRAGYFLRTTRRTTLKKSLVCFKRMARDQDNAVT